MEAKTNICGKKKFLYVLEVDIKCESDNAKSLEIKAKPDKTSCKKAIKGIKLTDKYLKKLKKLGYIYNWDFKKATDIKEFLFKVESFYAYEDKYESKTIFEFLEDLKEIAKENGVEF